jgi:hypothetical protein
MRNLMHWIPAAALAVAIVSIGAPSFAQTGGSAGTDSTVTPVDSTVTPAVVAPAAAAPAATAPTTTAPPAAAPASQTAAPTASSKPPFRDRIYYGGSVTLSFGSDVTRIGVFPMVAYKVSPKLSLGLEVGYEHVNYDNYNQSADNYGGSVFSNYRLLPVVYLHAEYQMINYEIFTGPNSSDRELVPFLLVGGGVSKLIGGRTWAYAEVLFDVLQDDNSPYDDWEPVVSVGVGVGF